MGINDLSLSPELIAALFPESLVEANDPEELQKKDKTRSLRMNAAPVYPFLGKNLRSICFLVNYPDDEFIPEQQFLFLNKILGACNCTLDDISLINMAGNPVDLSVLKKQFNARIIFLWGDLPAGIGKTYGFPDMIISAWGETAVIPVLQAD